MWVYTVIKFSYRKGNFRSQVRCSPPRVRAGGIFSSPWNLIFPTITHYAGSPKVVEKMNRKESNMKPYVLLAASVAAFAPIQAYANPPKTIQFDLTVSPGAKACLPKAHGTVTD